MAPSFDFSTFPLLETPRLTLRPLSHADAEAIIAIYGSPQVLAYLNMEPVTTREQALGLIDWFSGNYDQGDGVQWAFTLRESGQVIGTGGTYAWERGDRHVDIGYHVLPAYWGQGYATEATRAMLGWCFATLDVHRVQADCTDGNLASERVLLKCGFQVEGIWRERCWEHGRFVNIKQFGLLAREFNAPL
jgi:ribosomal-protein-alanine N-acetyltransferase